MYSLMIMVGMDRRTENNLRKKEARGSPVGLHEGTGNLQQPVRPTLHSLSTETEYVFNLYILSILGPT